MINLLFAYGTLRQGLRDDLLKAAGARLIGKGTIQARLYDLGPYPGIKRSGEPHDLVRGEVHRLVDPEKALATLDEYEGFFPAAFAASEFVRESVHVALDSGTGCKAWAYFYNRPVPESQRIPGGDYREFVLRRRESRDGRIADGTGQLQVESARNEVGTP